MKDRDTDWGGKKKGLKRRDESPLGGKGQREKSSLKARRDEKHQDRQRERERTPSKIE